MTDPRTTFRDRIGHQLLAECYTSTCEREELEMVVWSAIQRGLFFTVEPLPDNQYEVNIKTR